MYRIVRSYAYWFMTFLLIVGVALAAQEVVVTDISPTSNREVYFLIDFNQKEMVLRLPDAEPGTEIRFDRHDIRVSTTAVTVAGKPLFDETGVHLFDSVLAYERTTDLLIDDEDEFTTITFYTAPNATNRTASMRRGNRITFSDSISVTKGEFARGMIFTVLGAITVDGEVNKDVVSLFNDITVSQTAVIRGDVASIQGSIEVAREASIYGSTYTGTDKKIARKHRLYRSQDAFSWSPFFYYNRIDGATPNVEFKLRDPDSTLPTVTASFGYAFESSRWRVRAGLEQYLLRAMRLSVGGLLYRDLLSDDDWILSDKENTIFALLVTEDFKDYYEAIGGTGYLRVQPLTELTITAGYRNEVTNWLRAHRELWSLFGDKRFSENFTTVPEPSRAAGIAEIDTGQLASLYGTIQYDSRGADVFSVSAWAATLSGEYSHDDIGSDFDYKRFTFNLRRYQQVTASSMLLLRGMIGGSEGYLPMHRKFYLGGPGTLQGYRHKEFLGNRFWMTNLEFRQKLFKTDFALAFLWDVGQIGPYRIPLADLETFHSVGGALYLGDDVKISVAKSLDGRKGQSTRVYVRLEHVF